MENLKGILPQIQKMYTLLIRAHIQWHIYPFREWNMFSTIIAFECVYAVYNMCPIKHKIIKTKSRNALQMKTIIKYKGEITTYK